MMEITSVFKCMKIAIKSHCSYGIVCSLSPCSYGMHVRRKAKVNHLHRCISDRCSLMQGGSPDDMIVSTDMIYRYDDALIRGDGWMDTDLICQHLI